MSDVELKPDVLLRELLLTLFSVDDLRRFIRESYGDLVRALPGPGASPDHLFAETVLALEQRRLIDGVLFAGLLHERPQQYAHIAEVAHAWQVVPHDPLLADEAVTSPLPSASHPRPRSRLAGYRLQELLAMGSHGSVWRGEDPTGKVVALKILRHDLGSDPDRVERFFQGAHMLAAIEEPHIPKILLPHGEHRGWHFCVMQFIPGRSLTGLVISERPASGRVLPMILALGRTLERLHIHRLIHGDITPDNIIIGEHDSAYLVDFDHVRKEGLSAAPGGTTLPSPFMPPEVFKGHHSPGKMDDVFSLALTASSALLHERVVSFEAFVPGFFERLPCSPVVRRVFARALHASRAERYPDMHAFCEDLAAALGEAPARATLSWLHISDVQWGAGSDGRWTAIRPKMFADIAEHHAAHGDIDAVLFSGDLSASGSTAQLERAGREVLVELCDFLATLQQGRRPVLLAVPGNHDLTPDDDQAWDAERAVLARWHAFPDKQRLFWAGRGRYQAAIAAAFAGYQQWWTQAGISAQTGLLPGDFSATLHCGELRVGVLGLNTAFLDLEDSDSKRRLVLDRRQFDAACGGDGPTWAQRHHLCILMTHHPPSWLTPEIRDKELFAAVLAPAQFFLHLYGHQHDREMDEHTSNIASPVLGVQSPSLCGPLTFRRHSAIAGATEPRAHGYVLGKLKINGAVGKLQLWHRRLGNRSDQWFMDKAADSEELTLRRSIDQSGTLRWQPYDALPPPGARESPQSVAIAAPEPSPINIKVARQIHHTTVAPKIRVLDSRSRRVDIKATKGLELVTIGPIQALELLDSLAYQQRLLTAICGLPGVAGAALIINDGHVLAEYMPEGSSAISLAGTLVRSSSVAARLLRCSVARRFILCATEGLQLFIADLGAVSAVMTAAAESDPVAVRRAFEAATGVAADALPALDPLGFGGARTGGELSLKLRAFVALVGNLPGVRAVVIVSAEQIQHASHRAIEFAVVEEFARLARRVIAGAEVYDNPIDELRIYLDGEVLVILPLSPTQILVCALNDEAVLPAVRTALEALLSIDPPPQSQQR